MAEVSLRIEVNAGTKLENAFSEAIRLAQILNVRIRFKFNGIESSVISASDLDKCIAKYWKSAEEES